jgi:glycerol uptake facilitator-like aquaporin
LSIAAPFTGGHMNPGTTVAFHLLKKNKNMIYYFIAQFLGASIAGFLGNYCFHIKDIFFLM